MKSSVWVKIYSLWEESLCPKFLKLTMGAEMELDRGKSYVSQLVARVDGDVVELKGLPVDGGGAQVPRACVLQDVALGRTRNTQSAGKFLI